MHVLGHEQVSAESELAPAGTLFGRPSSTLRGPQRLRLSWSAGPACGRSVMKAFHSGSTETCRPMSSDVIS
jgi:hypothetical protein